MLLHHSIDNVIAIVGCGLSGMATFCQMVDKLIEESTGKHIILLFEKQQNHFAAGISYTTDSPMIWTLNNPASKLKLMSNGITMADWMNDARDKWESLFLCVTAAKENGFGGIVLDGNYRDVAKVEESKFPFFAVGICARAGQKRQGTIKQPIECGGVTVNPGDIIFADRDGIIVMNKAEAVDAIVKGEAIDLKEEKVLEKLRQGVKLTRKIL